MPTRAADVVATVLKEVSDVVNLLDDSEKVFESLVGCVTRLLGVRKCSLMMLDPETQRLRICAAHGLSDKAIAEYSSGLGEGIAGWVAREGKPLLVQNVEKHPLFARRSRRGYHTKSLLSVPLIQGGKVIGVLNVNNKVTRGIFTESDQLLLSVMANFAVTALDKARMRQMELEKEKMDADLHSARLIQEQTLPADFPNDDRFDYAARNLPASRVAGDFYDLIPLNDRDLCIVLGDVCGKGMPAALYMARVVSYFRAAAKVESTADGIMKFVNDLIAPEWSERTWLTATLLHLDRGRAVATVCNGGHHPPLLRRSGTGRLQSLDTEGSLPLGLEKDMVFEARSVSLRPGDLVMMYTDGVTEARDPQDRLFGTQRLRDLILAYEGTAEPLVEHVVSRVLKFAAAPAPTDDVTVVAVHRR